MAERARSEASEASEPPAAAAPAPRSAQTRAALLLALQQQAGNRAVTRWLQRAPAPDPPPSGSAPGGTPLTPDEIFTQIILNSRAWEFNRGGPPKTDPRGVGAGVGPAAGGRRAGSAVFSVIQATGADGKLIDAQFGGHVKYGDPHAEAKAMSGLRPKLGESARGGTLTVVVDQYPCGSASADCMGGLRRFADEFGMELRVYVPTREQKGRPGTETSPRTAAMGAQRTDTPQWSLKEITPKRAGAAAAATDVPRASSSLGQRLNSPAGRTAAVNAGVLVVERAAHYGQTISTRVMIGREILSHWEQIEAIRRDFPDDFICGEMRGWENQAGRGLLGMHIAHAPTKAEAMAQLESEPWLETIPAGSESRVQFATITPSEDLGLLKSQIEARASSKAPEPGDCFIATAAYGTALAPELDTLRAYRDQVLRRRAAGRAFVAAYYRLAPRPAAALARHDRLRAGVRVALVAPAVRLGGRALKPSPLPRRSR
jgi:hypothetical protein